MLESQGVWIFWSFFFWRHPLVILQCDAQKLSKIGIQFRQGLSFLIFFSKYSLKYNLPPVPKWPKLNSNFWASYPTATLYCVVLCGTLSVPLSQILFHEKNTPLIFKWRVYHKSPQTGMLKNCQKLEFNLGHLGTGGKLYFHEYLQKKNKKF